MNIELKAEQGVLISVPLISCLFVGGARVWEAVCGHYHHVLGSLPHGDHHAHVLVGFIRGERGVPVPDSHNSSPTSRLVWRRQQTVKQMTRGQNFDSEYCVISAITKADMLGVREGTTKGQARLAPQSTPKSTRGSRIPRLGAKIHPWISDSQIRKVVTWDCRALVEIAKNGTAVR